MGTEKVAGSLGSLVICPPFYRLGRKEGSPAWGAKLRATDIQPVRGFWMTQPLSAPARALGPSPGPLCS